jgi:RNA polymerase sigma-70 factor (ECF subfamily)
MEENGAIPAVAEYLEETECVRRAQTGDRAAFAALVDRYWERLRRWLFALTGKVHLAEDLTQEAFTRAWATLPRLQAQVRFQPWLFRIARNCLLDNLRGRHSASPQPFPEQIPSREEGPLGELLEREARQALLAALARLPEPYRAAYLLWTQEDLPYSEIAAVLAVSEVTARWRVFKARQFLLNELRPYLAVPEP